MTENRYCVIRGIVLPLPSEFKLLNIYNYETNNLIPRRRIDAGRCYAHYGTAEEGSGQAYNNNEEERYSRKVCINGKYKFSIIRDIRI